MENKDIAFIAYTDGRVEWVMPEARVDWILAMADQIRNGALSTVVKFAPAKKEDADGTSTVT